MNNLRKNQKGLSLWTLLFCVAFLALVAIYGSQIGLGYLNQQTIRGAAKNALLDARGNENATAKTIKDGIVKKLVVNTIDVPEDNVSVQKTETGFEVNVEYIKEIKVSKEIKIVMDLSFTEVGGGK